MSKITITGIDLAKNIFHLHAVDSTGRQVKAIWSCPNLTDIFSWSRVSLDL